MRKINKKLLGLYIALASFLPFQAFAQSSGVQWMDGHILTAAMMQTLDQSKMNISSLGKPGFAAKLDAQGRIDAPVVGDVSQARATTDGKTVSQIGQMAVGSVQKSQVGAANGVAPLDANTLMSAGVSGSVSNGTATATFPNSVARQVQSIISDTKNIKNYGAKLDDTQITTDMGIINSLIGSANSPQVLYMPTGIIWPHNGSSAIIPDAGTKNTVILAQGEINWWPSDPITDWNLGYSFPDFGSGVSALTYGTHGSFNFSRADVRGTSINTTIPNVNFDYYSDTPNQAGNAGVPGNVNVRLHTIVGKNKRGMAAGINDIFDSMSYGYYGDDDVQDWHHMGIWGTDWTWSNIREVNQFVPFYFSTKQDGYYNQATYVNEEDFSSGGPENATSAYDPTAANRKMFWLNTGYGTMGGGHLDANGNKVSEIADNVKWKAQTSYHRYQEIIVADSTGQPWLFYGLNKNYSTTTGSGGTEDTLSGSSEPAWNFTKDATTTDGDIIWTCIGPFTVDFGTIIGVSGENDPKTGWIARIGTLMEEHGNYIYNAIFDMSKAAFDPSVTHIFARMQKDMFLDLTADGTQAGQNNHLFGYDAAVNGLAYELSASVNGSSSTSRPFYVNDSGTTHVDSLNVGSDANSITNGRQIVRSYNVDGSIPSSQISLRFQSPDIHMFVDSSDLGAIQRKDSMAKADILAISSPEEGRMIYDTDDHEEVQYRCPTTTTCGWFPLQYGTALSN